MAIKTTYHCGGTRGKRYVRRDLVTGAYRWCIQDAKKPRFDAAQGTCEASDLPDDIRAACDAYDGSFYATEWPQA